MIGRKTTLLAALAATVFVGKTAAEPDVNRGRLFAATGGFPQDVTTGCAQCHQLDGTGDSSGAFPRLSDQSAWYLYKTLQDFAAGLRPSEIMAPIARAMRSEDMEDVAAYFASVHDAPYPAPPQVDTSTLQIGGAIVAAGLPEQGVPACSNCHGADGVGSPPIYPFIAGQYAPYVERQLQLWKHGQRTGDPLDVMRNVAQNMSDNQIHAVSMYLASIRNRPITPGEQTRQSLDNARPSASFGGGVGPRTTAGQNPSSQTTGAQSPNATNESASGASGSNGQKPQQSQPQR